jgi:hypothetical protein
MRYRVFAVIIAAAGGSQNSAALADPHCPVGSIYYRSKHTCISKGVAIDRGIYHYRRHIAAEPDGSTVAYRSTPASSAAAIPVPPIPRAHNGGAPARNENIVGTGSIVSPAPGTAMRSTWPYGALVPVTPVE